MLSLFPLENMKQEFAAENSRKSQEPANQPIELNAILDGRNVVADMPQYKQSYKVGDIISFGKYKWRVLAVESDRALIITENIIELRPWHQKRAFLLLTGWTKVRWASCTLREYLNSEEFYKNFNLIERKKIINVTNESKDVHAFKDHGYYSAGESEIAIGTNSRKTQDHIFLLSFDEVCKYFGSGYDTRTFTTTIPGSVVTNKDNCNARKAYRNEQDLTKGWGYDWWIRTSGGANHHHLVVTSRGEFQGVDIASDGDVIIEPGKIDYKGVRPALWLKLD